VPQLSKEFELDLSDKAPSIMEQVWRQDLRYDTKKLKEIEKIRTTLREYERQKIITSKSRTRAYSILFRKVTNHVMNKNKVRFARKSKFDDY
jgi:uncharacterized protein YfeS